MTGANTSRLPGALILSLDFELAWGLRDFELRSGAAVHRLMGARRAVPRMLELFDEFDVAATWATVGFLFAESREELLHFSPALRPAYRDPRLDAYLEVIGDTEKDDPIHFAASLVKAIQRVPRQEIATHTYSHYYCGEEGQNVDSFRADLEAACAIAASKGIRLRSIVFPRNQHNPRYDEVVLDLGFRAYRGNPRTRSWRFRDFNTSRRPLKRLGRLAEAYLGWGTSNTTPWSEMREATGLSNIRASGMLRPYRPELGGLDGVRLQRLRRSLSAAAKSGRVLHLWWHPHNFGVHQEENLAFLRRFLIEFAKFRDRYGMESLSMADADRFLNWEGERVGRQRERASPEQALATAEAVR